MDLYTLIEKKQTREFHLFEATRVWEIDKHVCRIKKSISLCEKMKLEDKAGGAYFYCEPENNARIKCAEKGKSVCGICVSTLYTTNPK